MLYFIHSLDIEQR